MLSASMLGAGRLLSRAAERFFRHVVIDDAWRDAVEEARARGPVVYVLRNVSAIDYLALEHLTSRFALPRIGFVNELPRALAPQRPVDGQTPADALRDVVTSGQSAALFVKRPPTRAPLTLPGRGRSEGDTLLETLLDLQASRAEREIMMMPQTFVWTERPERRGFSLFDSLFGPADYPGELRQLGQFLLNYKNGVLRAGEPLSLREFLAQPVHTGPPRRGEVAPVDGSGAKGPDHAMLVSRLTYALLRKVERERRTIVGPAHKAPDRMREEVLRSPRLGRVIAELSGPGGQARALLTDKARTMLKEMQTIPDVETQRSLTLLATKLLDRVYSGIDVDREGLERLRKLRGEGSVVLLPSHKSHMDYIVLSYVLRQNNIQIPVIAAGDNLAFFPAGPVLRRAGAFFIRRSFRGDRLYTAVVDAYVRRLLRDGWMIEFFIEGGRSRTGKLLPPMLGLLNIVLTSALGLERPVFFQPIAIGYERLMEEGAYARELSGEQKESEDAAQLLKLGGVLSERWGRVNIQFGEPIELGALGRELGTAEPDPKPARRRALVKKVAHKAMSEINRVTAVTPGALVALVLLSHGRRGVMLRDLVADCRRLTALLLDLGARASPSLASGPSMRDGAVAEALRLYLRGGLIEQHLPGDTLTADTKRKTMLHMGAEVIFTVPDAKRIRLDLAKNHIAHWLVDRALVAVALSCRAEAPPLLSGLDDAAHDLSLSADTLRQRVQSLSRLFKYEFMFRADATFEAIFAELLADMISRGELMKDGDIVCSGMGHSDLDGRGWVIFYARVVKNFIEGYRIAARGLATLVKGPLGRKDLLAKSLRIGERMFLEGVIERSEAVSKPLLDNAFESFVDQGYLVRTTDKLALSESFASEAGAAAVETRIAAYLDRGRNDDS